MTRLSDFLVNAPALRLHALAQLTPLERSVRDVLKRWPDVVPEPANNDREALAQEMNFRVTNWKWAEATTSRVCMAALAVYDAERCARPDLLAVRRFYENEIVGTESAVFLQSMFLVYLQTFSPNAMHSIGLAAVLSVRRADLHGRAGQMLEELPFLLDATKAASALAENMAAQDDPYTWLRQVGFQSPHNMGLCQAAHIDFTKILGPNLSTSSERAKMLAWLVPQGVPALTRRADLAIEGLIQPWLNTKPPEEIRKELSETLIAAYRDLRLHEGGVWAEVGSEYKVALRRWLTEQDMLFFCNAVSNTQDHHHWLPRRNFWLKLYDQGRIDEAWVAFGKSAYRYARNELQRQGERNPSDRFGRQLDRGENTSLLIMRIGSKIVVDGCNNYKTHVFRTDDANAPRLYKSRYHCDDIMRSSRKSKPHNSIQSWQTWVNQNV